MKARILIVENENIIAKDIEESLKNIGYEVCGIALTSRAAITKTISLEPDIILMDIKLDRNKDGIDTAIAIRELYDVPIVYVTAFADTEILERAKKTEPHGYLIKPFDDRDLQTSLEIALYKHTTEKQLRVGLLKLHESLVSTVNALAYAVEMRDPYTAGHQKNVSKLACGIAEQLQLSEEKIEGIKLVSLVHDIGKIHVPAEILSKPSALTDAEFEIVQTHPQIGYDILKNIEFPWPVAATVLQHHERLNGSGYPFGLKNKDILLEAKILSVADVVEAMTSHRPYRPAYDLSTALKEVSNNVDDLYDHDAVRVCKALFEKKGYDFIHNNNVN